MSGWLRELRELQAAGKDCVRVTIMDVRGSAPREIGATMLVTADDLRGSIGGGQLEYTCTHHALQHLSGQTSATGCSDYDFSDSVAENAEKPFDSDGCCGLTRMRVALGAAMGQCCGGVVDVLFEVLPGSGRGWVAEALRAFAARAPAVLVTSIGGGGVARSLVTADGWQGDPPDGKALAEAQRVLGCGGSATCLRDGDTQTLLEPLADETLQLALFGAGHVGSALVNVLAGLDWRVRWIDGRRDIFPHVRPANVTVVESAEPSREVLALPAGAYYLVMTHSHALDYEVVEQVLARDDFAYCGLIGSLSKRRRFEKRLRAQGMSDASIDRLTCPIGIAGVEGKRPAEIAIAVAAQLLRIRQSKAARTSDDTADDNVHRLRR